MCGHGTIGIVTFALEHGLIVPAEPGRLRVEVPAGIIDIAYGTTGDRVTSVRLTNVPAYVAARGIGIDVDGLGPLTIDVAYGGNFYAIIAPQRGYPGTDYQMGKTACRGGVVYEVVIWRLRGIIKKKKR